MSSSQGSRFSEYTATDHQAPLWIATSITLAYAGLFLVVRLAVKFKVLGLDDLFLGIAHVRLERFAKNNISCLTATQVFGIAQWGIMFAALHNVVGKSVAGMVQRDDPSQTTGAQVRIHSSISSSITE